MVLLSLSAVFTDKNRVWSTFLANGLCDPFTRDTREERRRNQAPHNALHLKFHPSHGFSRPRSASNELFQSPN